MIADTLQHASLYEALHPLFSAAFAFIRQAEQENLPAGRYELDGSCLYANIQEYSTKSSENARPEGHRSYIDIQYICAGKEEIAVIDREKTSSVQPYDPQTDAEFFAPGEYADRLVLKAGEFAVFFPHDLHTPCLMVGHQPETVKKIVVKVNIDQ